MRTADDFINDLLIYHGISFKAIYDCNKNRKEDIDKVCRIFDLKTGDDIKQCLTLLRLLTFESAKADKIIEYFKEEHHISLNDDEFEKNKVFLSTALVYQPSLLPLAWNTIGFIRLELQKQEQEVTLFASVKSFFFKLFDIWKGYFIFNPPLQVDYISATGGTGTGWKNIWNNQINANKISGLLQIDGVKLSDEYKMRFRFTYDEYHEPPAALEFEILVLRTKESKTIRLDKIELDNKEKNELILFSDTISGVDYTAGLEITKIRQ
jgi:hypothetical protein